MLSTLQPACQWEIKVVVPGRYAEPLQDCGLFESRRAAELILAAVRIYLHEDIWCATALGALPDAFREEVEFLKRGLLAMGIDPTATQFLARRAGLNVRGGENCDSALPGDFLTSRLPSLAAEPEFEHHPDDDSDDDGDEDDTPLAPPDTTYTLLPAGDRR